LQLNGEILSDKLGITQDVAAIARDIAGVKGAADIAGSSGYQTVTGNLTQIKANVQSAKAIDYKTELTGARGSVNADAALQDVISKMNQKKSLLDQALTLAASTKTVADNIYTQKKAELSAWQGFNTQAVQLKQTIDSAHQQIATVNDEDGTLTNQIVATFSANENILSQNAAGTKKIESELAAVKTQLGTEYNGKVAQAGRQYDGYRKSKDYTDAIKQLNTIISLQNNRLSVLNNVHTELQTALSDLDSLVASGNGASSAAGT
jgi:chromosome segregation ATPase